MFTERPETGLPIQAESIHRWSGICTAIEYFLQSKGVITAGDPYCYSTMLTGGDLQLSVTNNRVPIDFAFGDASFISSQIASVENRRTENRGENFMDRVYMALLPYALLDKKKRDHMQATRKELSDKGGLKKGEYHYYYFENGIPGITDEETVLRENRVYIQISTGNQDDTFPIWKTMANLKYAER